jgi:glycosyltransferase involved in cell wall biosynthesis
VAFYCVNCVLNLSGTTHRLNKRKDRAKLWNRAGLRARRDRRIQVTKLPSPIDSSWVTRVTRVTFSFLSDCEILHAVMCPQRTQDRTVQTCDVSSETPLLSVIVAVYNDWAMLNGCQQSLAQQAKPPSFEVIIVDDGSAETAPESIRNSNHGYPLTLIRQSHAGIAAARNRGIRASTGAVLLFVDADSRLDNNCLMALSSTIAQSPQHDCFQLRLTGDCSSLMGRAEELRLINFQDHMLHPDGRIRYLNTAGFALRRTRVNIEIGVFDPMALRGEDTLLLASLMEAGELPLFVSDAIVEHSIPLSFAASLRKDFRSAYLERRMYTTIAESGVKVHITHRERLELLSAMWKTAERSSIGRSAWFALVLRQAFKRILSFGYKFLSRKYAKQSAVAQPSHVRER